MNQGILHRSLLIFISMVITVFAGCKAITGKKDLGVIFGTNAPETAAGEYLEHVVGGNAGAGINHYMDKQAKKLRKKLKGGKVERIGEGIFISFDSTGTFPFGSAELTPALKENLKELAEVTNDDELTELIIEAHADSTGTSEKNLELSQKRANAVSEFAQKAGIDKYRMTTIGYGEDRPAAKKKQDRNRRVEIVIIANHELTVRATKGDIN